MALIEAVLTYKPTGSDSHNASPIPIRKTRDPAILQALRDQLLREAEQDFRTWNGIDQGVAAMHKAEKERLSSVLSVLLPDEDLSPSLNPVAGGDG